MIAIQTIVATHAQIFVNALFAVTLLVEHISLEHATIVMRMFVQEHVVITEGVVTFTT